MDDKAHSSAESIPPANRRASSPDDIDCTHKYSLRISSHADLVAAARSRDPMFSMYSCRGKCREKARAYIRSLGYEPIEVAL